MTRPGTPLYRRRRQVGGNGPRHARRRVPLLRRQPPPRAHALTEGRAVLNPKGPPAATLKQFNFRNCVHAEQSHDRVFCAFSSVTTRARRPSPTLSQSWSRSLGPSVLAVLRAIRRQEPCHPLPRPPFSRSAMATAARKGGKDRSLSSPVALARGAPSALSTGDLSRQH